jgi:hypothetical protein
VDGEVVGEVDGDTVALDVEDGDAVVDGGMAVDGDMAADT